MTNTRDSRYRITQREYKDGAVQRVGFGYGYDNVGSPNYQEALHKTTRSELYAYDGVHRLTSWERGTLNGGKTDTDPTLATQTWSLDDAGNWTSTSINGTPENRTHDNTNFLTVKGGSNLARDDNGNTTNDTVCSYVYDAFNRIVNVKDRTTGDEIATYVYDTQNRRIRKEVTNGETTEFVYDGWRAVAEYDGSGNLDAEYVYGRYIDKPIVMYRDHNDDGDFSDANELLYYATNRMYSVAALLDTSGNVVEGYEYTAYGKVTILDSSFNPTTYTYSQYDNPYLYTGRRYDDESGLYYYRNRYHSPQLGRFVSRWMNLSVDPSGYQYQFSNPVFYTDALGDPIVIEGRPDFVRAVNEALARLKARSPTAKRIIQHLDRSARTHNIARPAEKGNNRNFPLGGRAALGRDLGCVDPETGLPGTPTGTQTLWDDKKTLTKEWKHDPEDGLMHELVHAFQRDTGSMDQNTMIGGIRDTEVYACKAVNLVIKEMGKPRATHPLRQTYDKKRLPEWASDPSLGTLAAGPAATPRPARVIPDVPLGPGPFAIWVRRERGREPIEAWSDPVEYEQRMSQLLGRPWVAP